MIIAYQCKSLCINISYFSYIFVSFELLSLQNYKFILKTTICYTTYSQATIICCREKT